MTEKLQCPQNCTVFVVEVTPASLKSECNKDILIKYCPPATFKLYLVTFFVSLGLLAQGEIIGYTSPALPSLKSSAPFPVSEEAEGWIPSLASLGSMFGVLFGGAFINWFGKKRTLHLCMVPLMAGWVVLAAAFNLEMLYAGRILTGFCCGVIAHVVVYISEISTPKTRGILGSASIASTFLGIVLINACGMFLDWRGTALSAIVPLVLLDAVLIVLPESPHWLLQNNRTEEAVKSLEILRGKAADINRELDDIRKVLREAETGSEGATSSYLKRETVKPFLISAAVMIGHQFTGINVVLFYANEIFISSGSSIDPSIGAVIIGLVQVGGTLISSFFIEKTGRKRLLFTSGIGMAASLFVFGAYFKMAVSFGVGEVTERYGWLPLVCLVGYLFSFSLGFAVIPWILVAELNTVSETKNVCTSVLFGFNCIASFALTKCFPLMLKALGPHGTYWFFGGSCTLIVAFVTAFLPETSGKTYLEIRALFSSKH